jgi:single-stranded DNA-binding protein
MPGSVNRVILLGSVGRYGVEIRYHPSGTPCASFMLVLTEPGPEGRHFSTLIPCEVWGKKAEAASALDAGQLVLFEGKLARRKKGEQWELIVSGFEVTPVTAPLPGLTGSPG